MCLLDLYAFGWLTGVWHLRGLFGGLKVLSAGECGVKPRGFGRGIFLSPLFVPSAYVFSKSLARTVPQRIHPPRLMWSHSRALWVLEWCC